MILIVHIRTYTCIVLKRLTDLLWYKIIHLYQYIDIFNKIVKAVKFANEERDRLACCSVDGSISVLRLDPPTVQFILKGHTNSINGTCN